MKKSRPYMRQVCQYFALKLLHFIKYIYGQVVMVKTLSLYGV